MRNYDYLWVKFRITCSALDKFLTVIFNKLDNIIHFLFPFLHFAVHYLEVTLAEVARHRPVDMNYSINLINSAFNKT